MENTKKEFALEQIMPYFNNPELCGYENNRCSYLTDSGKMCVAGKNLLPDVREGYKHSDEDVTSIFADFDSQSDVLLKSSCGILSNDDWQNLQHIHDSIARHGKDSLETRSYIVKSLLFTYDEFIQFSESIKTNQQ